MQTAYMHGSIHIFIFTAAQENNMMWTMWLCAGLQVHQHALLAM